MRLLLLLTLLFAAVPFAACNTPSKPHPKVEAAPTTTINDLNLPPPVDTNGRINRY
jgi:hypothetical protein